MDAWTLAIETSNPSACEGVPGSSPGVAIGRGGEVAGVELIEPAGRHDDTLMPAINRLVRRLGVKPREIGRVAVSVGPGGFTALRIAVATAKGIAEASGGGCIAVPTAMVVAAKVTPDGRGFVVALNSKRDAAFLVPVDASGRVCGEGEVASTLRGVGLEGAGRLIADRFLPANLRREAVDREWRVEAPVFDAAACLGVAFGRPVIDPSELSPLYGREPEAVSKWRELHPGSGT